MNDLYKVCFTLQQDGSGYPPSAYERVWARKLKNGNYVIDNIPFYIIGISSGDEIAVEILDDQLVFSRLVRTSGNSTFTLFLDDPDAAQKVRDELRLLGCDSEFNQLVGVVAVEIPAQIDIDPFLQYIISEQDNGRLDIEEGALRHQVS